MYEDNDEVENHFENIERLDDQNEMDQSSMHFEDSNYKLIETDMQDEDNEEIHYETQEHLIIQNNTESEESEKIDCKPRQIQQTHEYFIQEAMKPRDITINFFLNMAQTVSQFSPLLQAKVKRQIFEYVSNAEMTHLRQGSSSADPIE